MHRRSLGPTRTCLPSHYIPGLRRLLGHLKRLISFVKRNRKNNEGSFTGRCTYDIRSAEKYVNEYHVETGIAGDVPIKSRFRGILPTRVTSVCDVVGRKNGPSARIQVFINRNMMSRMKILCGRIVSLCDVASSGYSRSYAS